MTICGCWWQQLPNTSYNCHQDISSPTFVTNIVVTILSVEKPVGNVPWGCLYYYEKEKKISSQFKAVHGKILISGCHGQDTGTIWNIGGIQNIKRTDEAREIRRYLGNGIYLNWSEVRFFVISWVSGKTAPRRLNWLKLQRSNCDI